MIHPLSDVQTNKIGNDTTIWQYAVVLQGAEIGSNCNINCHTFIENDVIIGNHVTIKSGVYLWDGLHIENHVFIGPNVTFTNDELPRSKQYPKSFQKTYVKAHASIGAGAIILGGVQIGAYAMVAAGALVTKNVPGRALVKGSPARINAWLNDDGTKMQEVEGYYKDHMGRSWKENNNELHLINE